MTMLCHARMGRSVNGMSPAANAYRRCRDNDKREVAPISELNVMYHCLCIYIWIELNAIVPHEMRFNKKFQNTTVNVWTNVNKYWPQKITHRPLCFWTTACSAPTRNSVQDPKMNNCSVFGSETWWNLGRWQVTGDTQISEKWFALRFPKKDARKTEDVQSSRGVLKKKLRGRHWIIEMIAKRSLEPRGKIEENFKTQDPGSKSMWESRIERTFWFRYDSNIR